MHKKSLTIAGIIILFLFSCKKEYPDPSYESLVDTTFYCEATVEGDHVIFPFHDRPTFGTEVYGDSILINAYLNYRESKDPNANLFWITISKKYKITELTYAINNYGTPYSDGTLSNEEFKSMFQKGHYNYSTFDCSEINCIKSEGSELSYESYFGTTFKTEYHNKFAGTDEISNSYNEADFVITEEEWLSRMVVILEGTFNADIYSFYGNKISIRNGYFKAYVENIMYPQVLNKDILWNK